MYSTILFATDLKENHYTLCQQAAHVAHAFKAPLHLLHVVEQPASLQLAQGLGFAELTAPAKEMARAVLKTLGEALKIPDTHLHIEVGGVKQHILDTINALQCDLLIIGSHDTHGFPSFLGSTAHAMVNHAPCAVLTLREK